MIVTRLVSPVLIRILMIHVLHVKKTTTENKMEIHAIVYPDILKDTCILRIIVLLIYVKNVMIIVKIVLPIHIGVLNVIRI